MRIFELLGKILSTAAKSTAEQRASFSREYERQNPSMSEAERDRFNEFNRLTEKLADAGNVSVKVRANPAYRGSVALSKTLADWDAEWQYIGYLKDADLSLYNHCVGLYRHVISGKTMYVGRAIELNNGGFRKRLSDYRRESGSARKHQSGRLIYEHLDEIETYILIVGNTTVAVEETRRLEGHFVSLYNPPWNKQRNI